MKGVGGGHFRACFINYSIMAGLKLSILVPYHTFTLAIQYSIIFAGAKNHQLGLFIYCDLELASIVNSKQITFICLFLHQKLIQGAQTAWDEYLGHSRPF